MPDMPGMTERFELRLSPDLLDRIERWREQQPAKPSKAAAIRYIMELGLAEAERDSGTQRTRASSKRRSVS
jgi:hypothetical protein